MNKCIFMGRISSDFKLAKNKKSAIFNLAVRRNKDFTDFVPIQLCGENNVENLLTYFQKGDPILVHGAYNTYKKDDETRHIFVSYDWEFPIQKPKRDNTEPGQFSPDNSPVEDTPF